MREVITTVLEVAGLLTLAAAAGLAAVGDPTWAGCAAGGGALLASSFVIQLMTRGDR
jgi:hypothetical protein